MATSEFSGLITSLSKVVLFHLLLPLSVGSEAYLSFFMQLVIHPPLPLLDPLPLYFLLGINQPPESLSPHGFSLKL
jgi:hypothetical protein